MKYILTVAETCENYIEFIQPPLKCMLPQNPLQIGAVAIHQMEEAKHYYDLTHVEWFPSIFINTSMLMRVATVISAGKKHGLIN